MNLPAPAAAALLLTLWFGCADDPLPAPPPGEDRPRDTLVLETRRVPGGGLLHNGMGQLLFSDTVGLFPYPVRYPEGIKELRGSRVAVDLSTKSGDYIDVVTGRREGKEVFVVDQNDNHDFRDDPVRPLLAVDWAADQTIPVRILVPGGDKPYADTSWLRIGISRDDVLYGRNEHLTTETAIGGHRYQFGVTDQPSIGHFVYGLEPELVVLATDGNARDTVLRQDRVRLGEYVTLVDGYYRFDSITHDGGTITLVLDEHAASAIGNQAGMLAPEFKAVTTAGDTLYGGGASDRPTVIANSCGCGGDVESTQAFQDIRRAYGDKIYALRIDSEIRGQPDGWNVDIENPFNDELYNSFRQTFCSRIGYLLGQDGRILERFDIMQWHIALAEHLD